MLEVRLGIIGRITIPKSRLGDPVFVVSKSIGSRWVVRRRGGQRWCWEWILQAASHGSIHIQRCMMVARYLVWINPWIRGRSCMSLLARVRGHGTRRGARPARNADIGLHSGNEYEAIVLDIYKTETVWEIQRVCVPLGVEDGGNESINCIDRRCSLMWKNAQMTKQNRLPGACYVSAITSHNSMGRMAKSQSWNVVQSSPMAP